MPTDSGLTELIDIDASRIDLVKSPANGFPILLMKAVNAQGGIDEKPDISGAEHVMVLLAKLIQSEAAEMAVGAFNEVHDIQLLTEAACMMRCFMSMEQMGDEDDGEAVYKSLDDSVTRSELEQAVTYLLKRKVSSGERKRLAEAGHALPDGSYPIENEEDLHNAAILAKSGHGDVAAAKRLIAKRAKELGVANPLANDMSKDAEVPDKTEDKTSPAETPEVTPDAPVEKSVGELAKEEVAKAVQPLQEVIKGLEAEMAVLKSTPIPGGPMVTAPGAQVNESAKAAELAKAQHFENLAKDISGNPELTRYYMERAAEARQAAKA